MTDAGVAPEWDEIDRMHKALRVAGLSSTALASRLGVHRNTINNYLRGKIRPDRRTILAWAMATGVSHEWLSTGAATPGDGPGGPVSQLTRE